MPLIPLLECATDFAASSVRLSASGVPISGFAAPLRTAMPMPDDAMSTRLPAAALPCLTRSSIASAVRMTRSHFVPPSTSFMRAAAGPHTTSIFPCVRSNSGRRSSINVFTPLVQRSFTGSLRLDHHPAVLDQRLVGLDRHHAGRRDNLASLDVELAVVEVALDDVAVDIALRERARPVGAEVIGHVVLAVDIVAAQNEGAALCRDRIAGRDVGGAAQINAVGHGRLVSSCRAFHIKKARPWSPRKPAP